MGNEVSQLSPGPQTTGDIVRELTSEFPDFVPQSVLGNYKLDKVVHCVHDQFRACVVKQFFSDVASFAPYVNKILELRSEILGPVHPNIVPFEFAEASTRSAILVRPFFGASVFDRLYAAPHLTEGQKKFIALQMTAGVLQLHSLRIVHGNIKLENFFIAGNLSIYLTDPGIFKPVNFPADDPVALYSLFHEAELKRRKCFIAPERFVQGEFTLSAFHTVPFTETLAKSDAFSLGCALVELFLDGMHVVDLPELLLFRAGTGVFDPALDKIGDPAMRQVLQELLAKDPSERSSVSHAFDAILNCCPSDFGNLLLPLFSVVNSVGVYQSPDARMALIRQHVSIFLGELGLGISDIDEFTHVDIFNAAKFPHAKISRSRGKMFFAKLRNLWSSEISIKAASEVFECLHGHIDESATDGCSDPETLEIFIGLVCSTGAACTLSRTRQVYLEILAAATPVLPESALCDLVIPYVQEFIASENVNSSLRAKALDVLARAVRMLKKSETGLFSDYVFPGLLQGDPVQNFPCALVVASEAVRLAAMVGEDFEKKLSVIRIFVERAFLRVSLNKQTAKQMMIEHMDSMLKFVDEKTVFSVLSGFLSDAQWQVRSDACRKLTIGNFLSPHALEKIIIPGVMNCLYDADERVVLSALRGSGYLLPSLSTKQRIQLAEKVFPLLHHPSKLVIGQETEVLLADKLSNFISQVDQLVFLRQWLLPHRCLEELGSSIVSIPYDLLDQLAFRESVQLNDARGSLAGVAFEYRREVEKLRPFISAHARGMMSRVREDPADQYQQHFSASHALQVSALNGSIGGLRDFRFLAELESHMRPKPTNTADRRAAALCLPAAPLELGTLSQLDGSYLNFYDVQSSSGSGLVSLQRDHIAVAYPGAPGGKTQAKNPEGVLLATLYDFSGERIVSVDCSDDGRILAVGGDKRVLCYRLGNLDREAYLSSSKQLSFSTPVRKLKTVRNSKSVLVGIGHRVELYRLDVRGDQPLTSFEFPDAVVDVCQFDASFESCVFSLTRSGHLIGWDYRSNHAMSRLKLPTLALPSGFIISRDATTAAVAYLSGKLTTVDLRKNIINRTFRGTGIQTIAPSVTSGHAWVSTPAGDVCEFNLETGGAPKSHYLISDTAEAHAPIKIPHLLFADELFLAAHAEFEECTLVEAGFGCRAMRATSVGLFTAHNDAVMRLWNGEGVATIPRLRSDPAVSVTNVGNVRVVAQQPPQEPLNVREAHRDAIVDFCLASLQTDMVVTAGRDGLVKIWK